MKKNIAVGALLSALLVGVIPVNGQARETVFDVSKIRLMKPNQGSGIEAYPDSKFNLLTNMQECREYNAKCYPYDETGSLEISFNQPLKNYTIQQTLTKPNYKDMRVTLYDDFGESFVILLGDTDLASGSWGVTFERTTYAIKRGNDMQMNLKLVGNGNKISVYINGIERATAETSLSSLKAYKETFFGNSNFQDNDKLQQLLIVNDAN